MRFQKPARREAFNPYPPFKPWFKKRQSRKKKHIYIAAFFTAIAMTILLVASPWAMAKSGELLLTNSNVKTSAVVQSTHVDLAITGMVAHVTYSQAFVNQSQEWVNAIYTFPLSEQAAVNRMKMVIGERIINGKIKAKPDAKKAFEDAKKAGKKASLTEQQRPNIFTQHIANIAPGEKISVLLQYIQPVIYRDGRFSFHLPTTLTPRYIPGIPLKTLNDDSRSQTNNLGWGEPTNEVPDADKITPFMISPAQEPNNLLTFKATLNTGLALESVSSRSHAISWQTSNGETSVELVNQYTLMNKDIWLSWQPEHNALPQAALFKERVGQEEYAMVMLMPPQVQPSQLQDFARDITFIIDTSGSMDGRPIEDAKASLILALKRLEASDKFNIIAFNNTYTSLFKTSAQVSNQSRQKAIHFVSGLTSGGGTEMAGALAAALRAYNTPENDRQNDNHRVKQVVFITDGAVGNESALFALIKNELGNARLFTVGIGSAPNSYFMTRAAQFGRGSYAFINDSSQIQKSMTTLFNKLESPVLSNLSLSLPNAFTGNTEIFPKRIPDLYAGEPLLIHLKMAENAMLHDEISLSGVVADTDGEQHRWQRTVSDNATTTTTINHRGIATAWARKKVASLMDEKMLGRSESEVKQEILAVALPHQLLTAYTSFVAVEEQISRPLNSLVKDKPVLNTSPAQMQTRAVSFPQTAAGINFHWAIAALCVILLALTHAKPFWFPQHQCNKKP